MSERSGNTSPPFTPDLNLRPIYDASTASDSSHIAHLLGQSTPKVLRWFPSPDTWDWLSSPQEALQAIQARNRHHGILKSLGVCILPHFDFIGQSPELDANEIVVYTVAPFVESLESVDTPDSRRLLDQTLRDYLPIASRTGSYLDALKVSDYGVQRDPEGVSKLVLIDLDPRVLKVSEYITAKAYSQLGEILSAGYD